MNLADCYTPYDEIKDCNACTQMQVTNNFLSPADLTQINEPQIVPGEPTPTPAGNFIDWIKNNPVAAAAIGSGIFFLFFGSKKRKK
jgi:hypothetical protein